jgi:hypothetical protein
MFFREINATRIFDFVFPEQRYFLRVFFLLLICYHNNGKPECGVVFHLVGWVVSMPGEP